MINFRKYFIVGTNDSGLKDTMNGMVTGELIRCKDCKYRDEQSANCTRFRKDWYVQSNSFCSWAERKEE